MKISAFLIVRLINFYWFIWIFWNLECNCIVLLYCIVSTLDTYEFLSFYDTSLVLQEKIISALYSLNFYIIIKSLILWYVPRILSVMTLQFVSCVTDFKISCNSRITREPITCNMAHGQKHKYTLMILNNLEISNHDEFLISSYTLYSFYITYQYFFQ